MKSAQESKEVNSVIEIKIPTWLRMFENIVHAPLLFLKDKVTETLN